MKLILVNIFDFAHLLINSSFKYKYNNRTYENNALTTVGVTLLSVNQTKKTLLKPKTGSSNENLVIIGLFKKYFILRMILNFGEDKQLLRFFFVFMIFLLIYSSQLLSLSSQLGSRSMLSNRVLFISFVLLIRCGRLYVLTLSLVSFVYFWFKLDCRVL